MKYLLPIMMMCSIYGCIEARAQSRYEHYQSICNKIKDWSELDYKRKQFEAEKYALKRDRETKAFCKRFTKKEIERHSLWQCGSLGTGYALAPVSNPFSSWSTEDCIKALHSFNEREFYTSTQTSNGGVHTYKQKCDVLGSGFCRILESTEYRFDR